MSAPAPNQKIRIIRWSVGAILLAIIGYAVFFINSMLPIITGYPAKYLCSAVFITNRQQAEVEALDLNFSFIKYTTNKVNFQDSSVTSSFLWGKSKAIYRRGFGSTLIRETDEAALRTIKFPDLKPLAFNPDTLPWPMGNRMPDSPTGIDKEKLLQIAQKLIVEKAYSGNAFAFMVLHKGIPVAESYKPPFNAQTRFQSWSMAKSFTNALVGRMVLEGKLDIYKPVDLPEWQNDERHKISIHHLMQMQSGLQWNEDYGNRSDVTVMLYDQPDFARYAYERPLAFPVESKWYYSSGSVNVINYLMRRQIGNDANYYAYPHTSLFSKTGMISALFEVDASGTHVGSSYVYATARDYARFGLLYLQDGLFNNERVLPEGWVSYSVTPGSANKGEYGALFWLNRAKYYPSVPEDMYSCNGHEGQRIFIVPSKELVVVVLGYSPKAGGGMDFETLLKDIVDTIK